MTREQAIARANRRAERSQGREYVVIERTAHPAVAGGHAFIVGPADELHALAADATVVYRVTYNGTDGDGLASFTQSPGIA